MSTMPRRVSRRFPDYGWAWPRGNLDLLLKAVLHGDEARALEMGLSWLAAQDLDGVSFSEHRLLAALAERHGRHLSSSPSWPRLVGLQRHLWTRSRLSLRDATGALAAIARADLRFMVIKGASRIALDPGAQRGRVAHDIDILVQREDMRAAITVLLDEGWQAVSGAGRLRLEHESGRLRALNFLKGEFGDIDLHALAYHAHQLHDENEAKLWAQAIPVTFAGVGAWAPSAADRIALAVAHGALDAHRHSDWLVDIAAWLRLGRIDWTDLLDTLARRNILIPAASALSYLAQEADCPVPPEALARLLRMADGEGLRKRLVLIECKPRQNLTFATELLRGVVKEVRLARRRSGETRGRTDIWTARASHAPAPPVGVSVLHAEVPLDKPGPVRAEISFTIEAVGAARKMTWELSTDSRHLAILRHRSARGGAGRTRLRFTGEVMLAPEDRRLLLSARPQAPSRPSAGAAELAAQVAIGFSDLEIRFS